MSQKEPSEKTDHAEIRYDEQLDAVRIEWKKPASGEDFREVLNTGLALVKTHGATNWLADLREMGTVDPDDQEWTNEEWFPEALSTPLTKMAVVQSERRIQKMSVQNIMQEVSDDLTNHYFDNIQEARDWLLE